jgi:hypothetical protein
MKAPHMNECGFLTVDFIFSIVLIFGFTAVLFTVCLTMTVASITQYITFASARNFVVGHQNQTAQQARATAKYQDLVQNNVFGPLFKNGWFKISPEPDAIGDITQTIQGYAPTNGDPNLFWGVGTNFTAMILDFRVPFFGSTVGTDSNGKNTFQVFMGSYLGRDVTVDECMAIINERWTAIQTLNSSYNTAQGTYVPNSDSGC